MQGVEAEQLQGENDCFSHWMRLCLLQLSGAGKLQCCDGRKQNSNRKTSTDTSKTCKVECEYAFLALISACLQLWNGEDTSSTQMLVAEDTLHPLAASDLHDYLINFNKISVIRSNCIISIVAMPFAVPVNRNPGENRRGISTVADVSACVA